MAEEDTSILTRPGRPPDVTVAYGEEADELADVRYGSGLPERQPLIMLVHGGYWRPTYDRHHTNAMSTALSGAGWTVASLEYRRIPGNPDATLQDVSRAVERLPSLVQRHNGKVVLIGHSAGGHLVIWAGATTPSRQLVGILALAPVADLGLADKLNLGDGAVRLFLGTEARLRSDADPQLLRTPRAPVTIIHGETDDTVPLEVSRSYANAHPGTRLVALPGVGHFPVIDPKTKAWESVMSELERWRAA
ncbi:MAG TPA: alpha/beta hydrolase [Steroidobacter sp.]